jgi:hypothetical protein
MDNTPKILNGRQAEGGRSLELVCACVVGFAFSANYTNHAPLIGRLVDWSGSFRSSFLALGCFSVLALATTFGIRE